MFTKIVNELSELYKAEKYTVIDTLKSSIEEVLTRELGYKVNAVVEEDNINIVAEVNQHGVLNYQNLSKDRIKDYHIAEITRLLNFKLHQNEAKELYNKYFSLRASLVSVVLDPNGLNNGVEFPLCTADALDIPILPKEERLIEIVSKEKKAGRKVAIFLEHTGTRDLIPDITERLGSCGIKSLILRSETPPTLKREEWLIKNVKEQNPDVLICNPNLVKTGLDLLDFPTIIFFQAGFNIYTLRQSSRRSWRIGQSKDVKVIYMAYEGTAQERALRLIATKLETSNAVEGKLSADGLTAMSSSDSSLMYAIARELVDNSGGKSSSLKSAWNDYKKSEVTKEESLTDNESILAKILDEITEVKVDKKVEAESSVVESVFENVMVGAKVSSRQLTIEDFLSAVA